MKASLIFLSVVASVSGSILDKRAVCNADNCARAVTGTVAGQPVSASRVGTDCASFQKVTVYPSAVTVTTSSGSTSATITPSLSGTTVFPTNVPPYVASACSSGNAISSRFASACSCAGATKVTSTAATPTVTIVVPKPSMPGTQCPTGLSGSQGTLYRCDQNAQDGQTCYCFQNVDGNNYCGESSGCGNACVTNADCGAGNYCAADTYCGYNACIPGNYYQACVNGGSPARLFKKQDGQLWTIPLGN